MSEYFEQLLAAAEKARDRAYAPYSNFPVGAAVLSKSGQIYAGCNVENSSYGLTICAERSAVFKMVGEGEREIAALLVIGNTEKFLPPCGACRQVIAEFSHKDTLVYMCNRRGEWEKARLSEILPYNFSIFENP